MAALSRKSETVPSLIEQMTRQIRQQTHGRIRGLEVVEDQGTLIVRGIVPSHHTRQLALHAALELVSGDRCRPNITVG
jgi:hypothetical protein